MIWLIGSSGQLGSEVAKLLKDKKYKFISTNSEVDISDWDAICKFERENETASYFESKIDHYEKQIKWIINCSAFNKVDKAENNVEKAVAINTQGPTNLARLSRKIGAKLIHVSTDYVFDGITNNDGTKFHPYTELSPKAPLNVYGKSKLDGEIAIEKEMVQYYIFRTSWLYGYSDKNFVSKLISKANTEDELDMVIDQVGCPTFTKDLAGAIVKMMEKAENAKDIIGPKSAPAFGVYNYCNSGEVSRFVFAQEIVKLGKKYGLIKKDCKLSPIYSSQHNAPAIRPCYSALDCSKICKELKIKIPGWKHSLEKYLKSLR